MGMPNNGQKRHKHPPPPSALHTQGHTQSQTHSASLQKYLEPICTNDSRCLMHFMEDEVGYSFGGRKGVGEVSRRSALLRRFPSARLRGAIFQQGAPSALGPAATRFITDKVGSSPDCLKIFQAVEKSIRTPGRSGPVDN